MTIYDIKEKYRKYRLEYDVADKMLFIYKDIPVKVFVELKRDLAKYKIKLNDIRVVGR